AGEPNFDGLDANPYRSAKQRQEWEVKALLEKIQPELITLDPTELAQVDRTTFEQRHRDRVEALVSFCFRFFSPYDPVQPVTIKLSKIMSASKGRYKRRHIMTGPLHSWNMKFILELNMVTVQRPSGEATQLVETKAPAVEKVSHPPAAVDTGEEGSRWSNGKDQLNEQRTVVEKVAGSKATQIG
ncbi:hypothetical protein XENOCAPTIV_026450, partial [Xenoophorus captivus]